MRNSVFYILAFILQLIPMLQASCIDDGLERKKHLLISEVVYTPTSAQFVEIYNPKNSAIDLSNYYISNEPRYYRLTSGSSPLTSTRFFVAKFPDNSSIAAKGFITIAFDTEAGTSSTGHFHGRYDRYPDFTADLDSDYDETATGTVLMDSPYIGENVTLDGFDSIYLFKWNGNDDLVEDIDIISVTQNSEQDDVAGRDIVTERKSNLQVDGLDTDTVGSRYKKDRHSGVALEHKLSASETEFPHFSGSSLSRICLTMDCEIDETNNGNGIYGGDETSENWSESLQNNRAATPGS